MSVEQTLDIKEVSTDVVNNTSRVRILWRSTQTGDSWNGYTRTAKYYISVNGGAKQAYTLSYTLPKGTTTTILDTTLTVAHNPDGTGTILVSTWMDTGIAAGVITREQSLNLTAIARASALAAVGNVTLGETCNVSWIPLSAAFRYKLKFSLGGWSATTGLIHPNKTSTYTYGYVIPLEVANQVPTRTGTMTVTLDTYSDSGATKQVGTDAGTFTVIVPQTDETKPEVKMELTPDSALNEPFNSVYIQGKSKVKATLTTTLKYGAGVEATNITVAGVVYPAPYVSGYLTQDGVVQVKGLVKDSRGFYGTYYKNITVYPYSKPSVRPPAGSGSVVCARCDSEGNYTSSGAYLRIRAGRDYSTVDGLNRCAICYRIRTETGAYSGWETILEGEDTASDEVDTGAIADLVPDVTVNYIVQVGVIDSLGETDTVTIHVPSDYIDFHLREGGHGAALGEYATQKDMFSVAYDMRVRGAVNVMGGVNGLYIQSARLSAATQLRVQSKFTQWNGEQTGRQSFLLFGSMNGTPVLGVCNVNFGSETGWEGSACVSVGPGDDGVVVFTFDHKVYDYFVILSPEAFSVL